MHGLVRVGIFLNSFTGSGHILHLRRLDRWLLPASPTFKATISGRLTAFPQVDRHLDSEGEQSLGLRSNLLGQCYLRFLQQPLGPHLTFVSTPDHRRAGWTSMYASEVQDVEPISYYYFSNRCDYDDDGSWSRLPRSPQVHRAEAHRHRIPRRCRRPLLVRTAFSDWRRLTEILLALSDKTGTLTANKLSLNEPYLVDGAISSCRRKLEAG